MSHSPVLGLGSTRAALGSSNSIAVGKTPECRTCGNPTLGSTGEMWSVLISHGYLGLLLYVGFLLRSMWAYRHDRTPIGDAGLLALFLPLWFMLVYNALVMPLVITFISLGLLWRNQRDTGTQARPGVKSRLLENGNLEGRGVSGPPFRVARQI